METKDHIAKPPVKKLKLFETSEYFEKYFSELRNDSSKSDVRITMLRKEWDLHKFVLRENPFFSHLFFGTFGSRDKLTLTVEIEDENITIAAVEMIISSLYGGEILINRECLLETFAAAIFFQVEDISESCLEFIRQDLSINNLAKYQQFVQKYGFYGQLQNQIINLLRNSLVYSGANNLELLRIISTDQMSMVLCMNDSFIPPQQELELYSLLKNWVFSKLGQNYQSPAEFFAARAGAEAFLETDEGMPYESSFRYIRLGHLLHDRFASNLLIQDNIFSKSVLKMEESFNQEVLQMLQEGTLPWPKKVYDSQFNSDSFRSSFLIDRLPGDGRYFQLKVLSNLTLHLLLEIRDRVLKVTVERPTFEEESRDFSLPTRMTLATKVALKWLRNNGSLSKETGSNIRMLTLEKGEKKPVYQLKLKAMRYPVHLVAHYMIIPPTVLY